MGLRAADEVCCIETRVWINEPDGRQRHFACGELGDKPDLEKLIGAVKVLPTGMEDRLIVCTFYTRFVKQNKEPVMEQLLLSTSASRRGWSAGQRGGITFTT
jgi:hypothetical protein